MRNSYIIAALFLAAAQQMSAQSAFDAYSLSQTDLKGTARFMSMAGAFGALGGDLSALNQNPGGIGIYRSSEIGLTFDWNMKNTTAGEGSDQYKVKNTNFNFNNIGYVGTFRTNSDVMPNVNWGFSYNKAVAFNRHYSGRISDIGTSMTNYVAGQTNYGGWTEADLGAVDGGYNPYQESYAPWMSILAYNSYLINPMGNGGNFAGLYQNGTSGYGEFEVQETGQVNEYTISFGGNVYNTVYWGASLGITDVDYNLYSYYGESLGNAYVPYIDRNGNVNMANGNASWGMENQFRMSGTGVNFKLGVILKPINELRIGAAFHTPTFYSLKSEYIANTSYGFYPQNQNLVGQNGIIDGTAWTDEGYIGETYFDMKTPWRFIGSIAGVIGGRGIISLDYEHNMYPKMRVSYDGTEDMQVSGYIQQYYKSSDIIRIGAEFKVTPSWSLRAGYSYQTSPFTEDIRNGRLNVATAGTTLSYTLDDNIQYITAGTGYRYKAFYADFAFVHKNRSSEYYAFSPDLGSSGIMPPKAKIKDSNNEIVFTLGLKF